MDENRFWRIIDTSRERAKDLERERHEDFIDIHEQTLEEALRELSPQELIDFDERFAALHDLAYRWDLWGAAYWLLGGCGDDGFIDFRACLISLGKSLFYQVLQDPDTLADLEGRPDVPYMQSEGFQYIASRVYKEKAGREMPQAAAPAGPPPEPVGERFDHDDEALMRARFPKLVAKFPDMGD